MKIRISLWATIHGALLYLIVQRPPNSNSPVTPEIKKANPLPVFYKMKRMKVTAYCPCKKCCGRFANGITSIGKNAWTTFGVAAEPNILP